MKGNVGRVLAVGFMMQTLVACGADTSLALDTAETRNDQLTTSAPVFQTCNNLPFKATQPEGFHHLRSRMYAHLQPHHSAQDVIGLPGEPLDIPSWFAYGVTQHELANEDVSVTLDTCSAWSGVKKAATDAQGAFSSPIKRVLLGGYDVVHEVIGDGSQARSRVWGFPAGTHFVVFDIDGTLTVDNGQFFEQWAAEAFDRGYTPVPFVGGAALTKMWLAKGYIPLYLTGRPHSVADITRNWLVKEGYAMGPVHVANHTSEIMPGNDSVGEYKAKFLAELQAKGYSVDYAYGNEPTDVYAYKKAGLAMDHVFTIGKKAGIDGSTPIDGDYTTNVPFVKAQPEATQPFQF